MEVSDLKNNDDKSYERYKQYRLNKYTYEKEQIVIPITVILVLSTIIGLLKYILIAIMLVCVASIIFLGVFLYLRKQLTAQPIMITEEDAKDGVRVTATVTYKSSQAIIKLDVPPNIKNGYKIKVKNVLFEDKNGRHIKKNVNLRFYVKTS